MARWRSLGHDPRGPAGTGAHGAPRALCLVVIALALLGLVAPTALAPSMGSNDVGLTVAAQASCNPKNPSPSAFSIPTTNPSTNVSAGGWVHIAYEIQVVNYTSSMGTITVDVPTAFATFHLVNTTFQVSVAPRTVPVTSAGWTDPNSTNTNHARSFSWAASFNASRAVALSTQKIAVMAGTGYHGALTLEVRWQWTVNTGGTSPRTIVGNWTVPSTTAKSPYLPSIFYPAPVVTLLGESNFPAPVDTNFTVDLGGAVAATTFHLVLEYPGNGTTVRVQYANSSSGIVRFDPSILLAKANSSTMAPGNYLVHVHDVCGAILHSLSMEVTNESVVCNAHPPAPSALSIEATNAHGTAKAGSNVAVQYQVEVVGYQPSMGKISVYVPSAVAKFPLSPTGELNLTIKPATLTIGGGAWVGGPPTSTQYKLAAATTFNRSAPAYLSTEKLAVQSSTAYNGKVTLAFKWDWNIQGLGNIPWTKPQYNWTNPYLPSEFYPAPRVSVLSNTSKPWPGHNYTVELTGAVTQTAFRMVLEWPNGTELRHQDEYTSSSTRVFNATIPLAYQKTSTLENGSYLVHVHDVCDAILYSIPVHITNGSAPGGSSSSSSGGSSGGLGGLIGGLTGGLSATSPPRAPPMAAPVPRPTGAIGGTAAPGLVR